jgi:hypothetical protein
MGRIPTHTKISTRSKSGRTITLNLRVNRCAVSIFCLCHRYPPGDRAYVSHPPISSIRLFFAFSPLFRSTSPFRVQNFIFHNLLKDNMALKTRIFFLEWRSLDVASPWRYHEETAPFLFHLFQPSPLPDLHNLD